MPQVKFVIWKSLLINWDTESPIFESNEWLIDASTFGELLNKFYALTQIRMTPYESEALNGKYFTMECPQLGIDPITVDIHMKRKDGGLEKCLKQDLSCILNEGDVIKAGPLMC